MAIGDRATATSDISGSTTLAYPHSVAGSSNLVIWANVDSWRSGGGTDPTGITYAGSGLTKISNYAASGATENVVSLWRKLAPATGANNVVVTHSEAHDITAVSYSSSGVDQTTPNDAVQQANTADPDPTHAITSETGDLVVSFKSGWNWTSLGEDGDITIRLENANLSGVNSMAVADAPGAVSVNVSWTTGTITEPHGLMSFNVNAAGGGPVTVSGLVADASGAVVAPGVVLGSLTIPSLAATVTVIAIDPTVTAGGNVSVSGLVATGALATGGPGVVLGAILLSDLLAAATPASVAPAVALGSLSVANPTATVRLLAFDPLVDDGTAPTARLLGLLFVGS